MALCVLASTQQHRANRILPWFRSVDAHTVSSPFFTLSVQHLSRLPGTDAYLEHLPPCALGDSQVCQTREEGKGVRTFFPEGKEALQSCVGKKASSYSDTAHAHAPPKCLRETFLLPEQNHCPPGKGQRRSEIYICPCELHMTRRYGYSKPLSPNALEYNLYNENVLIFSYLETIV